MYNLPYFKENDREVILQFIKEHPFALLTGCVDDHPVATQIPVFIEEKEGRLILTGHMMKGTDHYKAFQKNSNVLCVFTGAHTYVSATWYDDPKQASTWNYMSVHAKGKIKFLGEEELIDVLQKTSLHFEGYNAQSSTTYHNLPDDYKQKLIKAIDAFEVAVESLDNVFKLSQNRNKKSYENIIQKLDEGDAESKIVADEMKKRQDQLFH